MKYQITLKRFFSVLVCIVFVTQASSQVYLEEVLNKVNMVSKDSVVQKLQTLENLGIKDFYHKDNLEQTAHWIKNYYHRYGYQDIVFDSFKIANDTHYNIVITKVGKTFPGKSIIVCGHYDTRTGPGVNDNGSGISTIMEAARVLSNIDNDYTLKFIHFSDEESGYFGSRHYVQKFADPDEIKLIFNVDEVGGTAGKNNSYINCERDEDAPSGNNYLSYKYTDSLRLITETYSSLTPLLSQAYNSDYVPFQEAGYVITGLYESPKSPFIHSIHDSLDNLDQDYTYQIARIVTAATFIFSTNLKLGNTGIAEHDLKRDIFYNPIDNSLNIRSEDLRGQSLAIYDVYGRKILESEFNDEKIKLDDDLAPGLYTVILHNNNSSFRSFKFIYW